MIQKKANIEAAVPKTTVVASVKREKKNTGRALMIEKRVKKPLNTEFRIQIKIHPGLPCELRVDLLRTPVVGWR